ncbi:dentin matrix acidic phosphoprotein 1 [Leptodactylus fuscus]|uniref:uncharacterized protein LOC142195377 n=1 Tax=Leptodactylus fuscus TaxID=238119 RepID=UPI003F4E6881
MKTLFIYGYVLGLTLASPITRFQECKEGRNINNTENGDHQEKTAHIQMQPHIKAKTSKAYATMQRSLNFSVTSMQEKKDDSGVKKQTSNTEIKSPIIKYHHRRDLSHITQKIPKRRNGGKKHRPNKISQGPTVYNTSRKIQRMFKHNLEKGSIIKQLQKRSIDYEDTPNDPYHSPDISYDWDMQEDVNENDNSQEQKDLTISTEDSTLDMNENTDTTDSDESDHTSSNESSDPRGSPESSSPTGPNESSSSNESSPNTSSEESISDVTTEPIVLNEASDSQGSSELNVQDSAFTTPVSETTNELSESKLSHESGSSDNSSQSNEQNKSSNSSDSSSNESSDSSDSNTSSHSSESTAQSDNSTENSSQNIEDTMITDDTEENEIQS